MIKNIVLVNCSLDKYSRMKIKNVVSSPNLGLMSIASLLIMHGYNVKMLDFFCDPFSEEDFKLVLNTFKPDVIGYSVYTRTVPFLKKIVYLSSELGYNGICVVGGPHASFAVKEMLNELNVDFVVRGEGEFTFLKLMESLNYPENLLLSEIKGISYKINNGIRNNGDANYIESLDALPLQPIGLIEHQKYTAPFTLITSRGCPGNCIYCSSRALSGSKYRMRSAENIICELLFLSQKLRTEKFLILDDTFTADVIRLKRFCHIIDKLEKHYIFRIESRVDSVSFESICLLKKAGCEVIHFGIESGSQEVIKKIGKNIKLNWAEEIMNFTYNQKIHVVASFIIGHYCDNESTIHETIALMKKLKNAGIEVSIAACVPFPGTPLYENRKNLGVTIHAHSWQDYDFSNVIISTKYLSCNELRELIFEALSVIA